MGLAPSRQEQGEINVFVEAAKTGDLVALRRGLREHLNGRDENGETALHLAAMYGHVDVVEELVQQGRALEVDPVDADETTPLMFAAHQGFFEVVLKLVRAGASLSKKDRMGWTALHHAAAGGHSLIVGFLVEKGSLPFERDTAGSTPLWLAADSGDAETVRLLLLYGADPDEENEEGISPVEAAREAALNSPEKEDAVDAIQDMLVKATATWDRVRAKFGVPSSAELFSRRIAGEDDSASRGVLRNVQAPSDVLLGDDENEFYRTKEELHEFEEDAALVGANPDKPVTPYQVRAAVVAVLKLEDEFVEPYEIRRVPGGTSSSAAGAAASSSSSSAWGGLNRDVAVVNVSV